MSAVATCAVAGALSACGGSFPRPPMVAPPVSAYEEVPYPPPAARAEVVPPKPDGAVVWLDGQWDWTGSSWRWSHGGWIVPVTGARYQPWTSARRNDGRLFFARATWRDANGKPLDVPPTVVVAAGAADRGPPTKEPGGSGPPAPATTAPATTPPSTTASATSATARAR